MSLINRTYTTSACMTCLSLFVLLLTPAYSSDNTFDSTLHKAAGTSNPEEIKALISAGAKVNAKDEDGLTPLHFAALNNSNPDVVKALISAGAKVMLKMIKMAELLCILQHSTTQTQM